MKALRLLIFSILFHAAIWGMLRGFSGASTQAETKIWQVALAQYPAPAAPKAHGGEPVAPQPVEPQAPKAQAIEPAPKQEKTISPKKKPVAEKKAVTENKPERSKAEARPQPAAGSSAPAGEAGGQAAEGLLQVGGLAAYNVKSVHERPVMTKSVTPDYPATARKDRIQGRVIVRMVVDNAGYPQSCEVHSAKPQGVFEESALAAARKTRFIPGKVHGKAVNTLILLPYDFNIK